MKRITYLIPALMAIAIAREPLFVTVNYADKAGIPSRTLQEALEDAKQLFLPAGIQIRWVNCTGLDGFDATPECLHNRPTRFRVTFTNTGAPKEDTLGFAYPRLGMGNRAAVLYSHVVEFSSLVYDRAAIKPVLAAAIAHELGHLFLGTTEHGDGIMLAKWRQPAVKEIIQRRMTFSPETQEKMRAGLESRQQQQDATLRAAIWFPEMSRRNR